MIFNMVLELKPIRTEENYLLALAEVDKIFHAKPNTAEGDRLEMLLMLIEKYESQHFPIAPPDPIEAIKFRMEQLGMTASELGAVIGYRGCADEILTRKRKLSLPIIRRLCEKLQIPAEVLVLKYAAA